MASSNAGLLFATSSMAPLAEKTSQASDPKKKSSSSNNTGPTIAIDFKNQLASILETKPPISKDKMGQITQEAIRSVRNYKHIVYYVETFIKNVNFRQ